MKTAIAIAIAIAAAAASLVPLAPAAGSESARSAAERRCKSVAFTPNSDDVAAGIRATGLTCGLARDFIRDSEGRPGARFRGFACTSTAVEGATLAHRRYRCTGAGDVIRWRRY